jgi:hypothetical protein
MTKFAVTYTYWNQSNRVDFVEAAEVDLTLGFPKEILSNQAMFCTKCGRVWARVDYTDNRDYEMISRECGCRPSTNPYDAPGSILAGGFSDRPNILRYAVRTLSNLPDAIVKREFDAHLKHFGDRNG